MMLVLLSSVILVTSVFGGLIGGDGHDLIKTPHGYRPMKCVHAHAEDAEITELEDGSGVNVYYPKSGKSMFIATDEDCVENAEEIGRRLRERANTSSVETWEDYASYTCPTPMANFTSTYGVPNQSPSGGSQLLYYFIGWQNNAVGATTIVQPVVNYDLSGQFPNGWSMAPWNCCPAGQSHTGPTVTISQGVKLLAWIYTVNGKVIIGQSRTDGSGSTQLTVSMNNRQWDWACATLEDYYASCSEKNSMPFDCDDMVLTSTSGANVTPRWSTSHQASCNGGVVVHSSSYVSIYGTDAP